MKHPLLVGYFDVTGCSSKPSVIRAIHLDPVLAILRKHCDKNNDGTLIIALAQDEDQTIGGRWLSQIEKEDVLEKDGYLVCPWLDVGFNKRSVQFICDLHDCLGMQIFEPGDRAYYSPRQLADIEDEFYQVSD